MRAFHLMPPDARLARRTLLTGLVAAAVAPPALALAATALQRAPKGKALRPPPGPTVGDVALRDADGKPVPARRWWPGDGKPWACALFSHGANSAPAKYDALLAALADAGIGVLAPLHRDSPDHPAPDKPSAEAALALRHADCKAVIDALGDEAPGVPLIAAGHSFGALLALMMAGATTLRFPTQPDPRVRLALAFSPPGAFPGFLDAAGFARVQRPVWVQTGTADALPPMMPDWRAHRLAFEAAATRPRLLWVGEGVDHWFGNMIGRPERPADPAQSALFARAADSAVAFARAVILNDPAPLDAPSPGATVTLVR